MRFLFRPVTGLLIMAMLFPCAALAQVPADVWRRFAESVDVGTELQVRLEDGKRFRATLVGVEDAGVLLQPKTRVPVAVQSVPYASIVSLARTKQGIGAGKATAIGVSTGVGAFWGMVFLALAILGD